MPPDYSNFMCYCNQYFEYTFLKDNQDLMSQVVKATEDVMVSFASNLDNYTFDGLIYESETIGTY